LFSAIYSNNWTAYPSLEPIMIDTKRLIAEVAAKHGICLTSNDPALCLITLNELVLEDAVAKVLENVHTANKDFEQAAEQLQARAGTFLAQQMSKSIAAARSEFVSNVDQATAQAVERISKWHHLQRRFAFHWMVAGIVAALFIFAGGILLGMTFR
jgi:Transcriptional activator TraM